MFNYNEKEHKFVKIVYSKVKENGKEELIPLRLYSDGSLEPNQ
jgi:hypothetical protein